MYQAEDDALVLRSVQVAVQLVGGGPQGLLEAKLGSVSRVISWHGPVSMERSWFHLSFERIQPV